MKLSESIDLELPHVDPEQIKPGAIWEISRRVQSPLEFDYEEQQSLYPASAQNFLTGNSPPRYVMIVNEPEPPLDLEEEWRIVSVMLLSVKTDRLSDVDILISSQVSGVGQDLLAETWNVLPMLTCNLSHFVGQRLSRQVYDILLDVGDYYNGRIDEPPTIQEIQLLGLQVGAISAKQQPEIKIFHQQESDWAAILQVPVAAYRTYIKTMKVTEAIFDMALQVEQELSEEFSTNLSLSPSSASGGESFLPSLEGKELGGLDLPSTPLSTNSPLVHLSQWLNIFDLSQWFLSIFETGWQPVEGLLGKPGGVKNTGWHSVDISFHVCSARYCVPLECGDAIDRAGYSSFGVAEYGDTFRMEGVDEWGGHGFVTDTEALELVDYLDGGDDSLHGEAVNDVLDTEAGNDFGDNKNDSLSGQDGVDCLDGGEGNYQFNGESGDDSLHGEAGNNVLDTEASNDFGADNRNDSIYGQDGVDYLDGGEGNDQFNGESGDDSLHGEEFHVGTIDTTGIIDTDYSREEIIAALIVQLSDNENELQRRQAIKKLGEIGTGNSDAITALTELLSTTQDKVILWTAAESLWQIAEPHKRAAGERRAKLIDLGKQPNGEAVKLTLALIQKPDGNLEILVQLYPTGDKAYLPPDLKLILLEESGKTLFEVTARLEDACIQLNWSGLPNEQFGIRIALEDTSITHFFVI